MYRSDIIRRTGSWILALALSGLTHAACPNNPALTPGAIGTATGTAIPGTTLTFDANAGGYVANVFDNVLTLSQNLPNGQSEKTLVARVTNVTSGQAALEWRRVLGDAEKTAVIGVEAGGTLFFASRTNGAAALGVSKGPTVAFPVWLKLVRLAGRISGYYSADGIAWTLLSSAPDVVVGNTAQAVASFTASGKATMDNACLDVSVPVAKYPERTCTTPNPDVTGATFSILADDQAEVLINGYYVGRTEEHQFGTPKDLDVDPCYLAGGVSLIAVKLYDNQDNKMGISYRLDVRKKDGTQQSFRSSAAEGVKYVYEGNASGRGDRDPYAPVAKDAAGNAWYDPGFSPDARWKPVYEYAPSCLDAALGTLPGTPWVSYDKGGCPMANAGNEISFRQFFGAPAVVPSLVFTDETGKVLGANDYWSPAKGKLYLTYTDAYVQTDLAKIFAFSIRNRRGAAAPDSESITVPAHVKGAGEAGIWKAEVPLAESRSAAKLNGTAEVFLLGELTATVQNHSRTGAPAATRSTAKLNVAYPDVPAQPGLEDAANPAAAIGRFTQRFLVTIKDQSFSRFADDTLRATAVCLGTADSLTNLILVEQTPGQYRSLPVSKAEGAADATDRILTCAVSDSILVTYADEVYGTRASAGRGWNGEQANGIRFTLADTSVTIDRAQDGQGGNEFSIVIKGTSPTPGVIDEISVTLTGSSLPSDVETLKLVETSANSGIFVPAEPVRFSFADAADKGNGAVEAVRSLADPSAGVTLHAEALLNGTMLKQDLILIPSPIPPNPVQSAYIKDQNGDGSADRIYLVFTRKLDALPVAFGPAYWNEASAAFANAAIPSLSFLAGTDQTTVVADYSASPFPPGLTGIPAGTTPFVLLPGQGSLAEQKPVLADSIGPVILDAKIAFAGCFDERPECNRDSLAVTVSEPLAPADFAKLIRFGKAKDGRCGSYANSAPVIVSGPPQAEGTSRFEFLVAADPAVTTPFTGDCIYLETGNGYADLPGNRPPEHGVTLKGPSRRVMRLSIKPYPSVAGTGAGKDPAILKDAIGWIPPVGFVPGTVFRETDLPDLLSASAGTDAAGKSPFPEGIASVQIIANRKYIASVAIFDNLGHGVARFSQSFGYRGELANPARRAGSLGWAGYLVWDMRDDGGRKAGQGVYIWKITLRFEDGGVSTRTLRIGVLRRP